MKIRISWFTGVICLLLTACTKEIVYDRSNLPEDVLLIDSYPLGFEKAQTRASKNEFEYQLANKTLFVFDVDGTKVHQTGGTGDASFVLDRKQEPFASWQQDKLLSCKLYIVGNLPDNAFEKVNNLNDLMMVKVTAPQTTIHLESLSNFAGLPMIGAAENVDLRKDQPAVKPVAPIILRTVYAKVVVDIRLKLDQNVPGYMPEFHLQDWQAVNVPGFTRLGETALAEETDFVKNNGSTFVQHNPEDKISGGSKIITNGGGNIQFYFYTLEHRVNPALVPFNYPAGIYEEEKQRFKPKLVDENQKPLYVVINGIYKDHQGHDNKVSYKLYLGKDNFENFHINRNCQLTNSVFIKGITNSSDGKDVTIGNPSVSVDHRVTIDHTNEDFVVEVERETMLDSHIEIRPIDVDLKTWAKGSNYVNVEICDPVTKTPIDPADAKFAWARFEKLSKPSVQHSEKYCSNGKRKSFTMGLMNELKGATKVTIDEKTDNRIWVYFDENLNASTDGMRDIMLRFTYHENNTPKKIVNYTFRQHDLYPVEVKDAQGKITKYYLEYYEEYLYNFDPKDPYANRTDGMAWGPNGLMSEHPAIEKIGSGSIIDEIINIFSPSIKEKGGKYDYKDNYKGKEYTQKLIKAGYDLNNKKDNFLVLPLDALPRSAAEYCVNKNKRKENGEIDILAIHWYLPAIGELQDITKTAYGKFKVFQNQLYWSSQSSYFTGKWEFNGDNYRSGSFFVEDTENARATKTELNADGSWGYLGSDVTSGCVKHLRKDGLLGITYEMPEKVTPIVREPGNFARNSIKRVRAIRKTLN